MGAEQEHGSGNTSAYSPVGLIVGQHWPRNGVRKNRTVRSVGATFPRAEWMIGGAISVVESI